MIYLQVYLQTGPLKQPGHGHKNVEPTTDNMQPIVFSLYHTQSKLPEAERDYQSIAI